MSVQLFDGSDSENDDISKIKIDEEYARRFEHNKTREDLQRFEELKKKGVIDSPSPSEDDESESKSSDDEYEINFNSKSEKEFFDALIKVKKKDPVLKQKDVKLFESDHSSDDEEEEEESDDEKSKSKDKKAMFLKDVMAKHLIEEGPDFGDNEEETSENEDGRSKVSKGKRVSSLNQEEAHFVNKDGKKTYGDEQEELKRVFLEAEKEGLGDEEGDFLTLKEKEGEDKVDSDDKELEEKQNDYFSGDYESNENYGFLRNYFMDKMWMDKNAEKLNVGEEDLQEISEDDMEIERQEEYEYQFQENPDDSVFGHARKVEGSVRKRTNTRKAQRKSKEERMAIAQKERNEEVKHLKNVKKREIEERVKKIMKSAGIDDIDDEKEKSPKKGSRKRKHKTSIWEIAKQALMDDEYYGIEYEDIIGGDLKTRFKYAKTKPNKFSISTPEILLVDDKELNQHIPLKKLAPYQEKEWKLSKQKRNMLKMRAKEHLHAASLDKKKIKKKSKVDSSKLTSLNNAVEVAKANTTSLDEKKSKVDSSKFTSSNSVVKDEKANTEESKSRKAKRREKMAKLKLSKLRLKAYGKTT